MSFRPTPYPCTKLLGSILICKPNFSATEFIGPNFLANGPQLHLVREHGFHSIRLVFQANTCRMREKKKKKNQILRLRFNIIIFWMLVRRIGNSIRNKNLHCGCFTLYFTNYIFSCIIFFFFAHKLAKL